ncbi:MULTISPECIES: type II secretion system minor pseudopilin GspI [unclassified Burkholderia]|uniref:type II secretion system minor pseudopilin GspI n=1 Tax=unclassified Burkholderia TaxID=2613784 RepID=UPI000AC47464
MRRRLPFPAASRPPRGLPSGHPRRASSGDRPAAGLVGARGFTMIEVLVALAIIAVALAASIRAVGTMATNASDLHRRLLAGWSADNALAQLRLTHAWPEVGEQSFDCSQGNLQLVCTQRVSTTPNPVFRRVQMSVSMPGRAGVLAQMVTVVANETSRPL